VRVIVSPKNTKAGLKALSGLSVNLSAAWYTAVFIVPNFSGLNALSNIFILTMDIVLGTLCLWISFELEKKLV